MLETLIGQTLNVEGLRRSVNLFLPRCNFGIGTPSQLRLQRFGGGQPPEISLQATHYDPMHGWSGPGPLPGFRTTGNFAGAGNLPGGVHIIVDEGLNWLVWDVVYNPCSVEM